MSRKFSLRWPLLFSAFTFLSVLFPILAQAPAQSAGRASQRAPISMEQEHHHHLEFENSYVRVFFVEIPSHESTLFHRHDFPYLSVPPTGIGGAIPSSRGAAGQGTGLPMIGYSPGNFSHAVSNSQDFALRNVAIELLRPQGGIHNRCEQAVRDQPKENCDIAEPSAAAPATHTPLLETDELSVEAWHIAANVTAPPWNDRADILLASLGGVSVTSSGGIDSVNVLKGGLLWLPAGSKPVFKTAPARDGHFIAITFKDSGSRPVSPSL
ncbi:MAG TPA: hypothetical protein VN788_03925 [Verrucomicrobiae bacterium]|nr:hypothetical protein [Verrucomicrobiae bacterium]